MSVESNNNVLNEIPVGDYFEMYKLTRLSSSEGCAADDNN